MSIFGDAWNWTKGAVSDVGDWASGAWDTVSGKSNYSANPYVSDLSQAYMPVQDLAGRQEASGNGWAMRQDQFTDDMFNTGLDTGQRLDTYGQASADVGRNLGTAQLGIGSNMSALGQAYGSQFQGLGSQASAIGSGYAGTMGGIGSNLAQTGANFGGQQSALAQSMLSGPSVAQAQGNAAMGRGDQEVAARIAGARGANANLMLRDAVQSGQMQRANLAADLAAASAAENVQRNQAASGMLNTAAQTTMAGQQGALNAQQAAAQAAMAGNQQAGQQYAQGAQTQMAGQQGALNATQGAANTQLAGYGQAGQAAGAAGAARQAGFGAAAGNTQTAAGLQMGGQAAAGNTLGTAAQTRTAQEQINAGSWDSSNATNAGVQTGNAKNQSEMTGGLIKGAAMAMMSDVRNKEAVHLLEPIENPYTVGKRRASDPNTGNSWEDTGSMLGQALSSRGSNGGSSSDQMDVLMSDERGKTSKALLSEASNRENLGKLHAYEYRYKPEVAARIGQDTEPRVGIMAQDLERAPAGKGAVMNTEEGKAIDVNRGLSFALAAAAGLDKRVKDLEKQKAVTSDERTKTAKSKIDPKYLGGVDDSIMAAASQREERVPEPTDKVGEYDQIYDQARPMTRPRSALGTAARAALAHSAEAAVLPVKAAGKVGEALGYQNRAAELSGNDLVADVDYLRSGMSPGESRRQRAADIEAHPYAHLAGSAAGEAVGGAGIGGMLRKAAMGAAGKAALGAAARAPLQTSERAYLEGRNARLGEYAADAGRSALEGAAMSAAHSAAIKMPDKGSTPTERLEYSRKRLQEGIAAHPATKLRTRMEQAVQEEEEMLKATKAEARAYERSKQAKLDAAWEDEDGLGDAINKMNDRQRRVMQAYVVMNNSSADQAAHIRKKLPELIVSLPEEERTAVQQLIKHDRDITRRLTDHNDRLALLEEPILPDVRSIIRRASSKYDKTKDPYHIEHALEQSVAYGDKSEAFRKLAGEESALKEALLGAYDESGIDRSNIPRLQRAVKTHEKIVAKKGGK